jgi:PAS domain S-box-containing protein
VSADLFRLLVESVNDYAIFMLDVEGRVATWNMGAERIKGYRADEIIGRHFSTFYEVEEACSGKCERELAIATAEGRFEEEGWRLRKDGSRFWASVVISAVRDAEGTLIGFAKVTRDLTERKRAQEDQTARLIAEEANRAKDEFLAMLGHELRNPLAPMVTALELLRLRGEGGSKAHEILERQVRHMMRLVDDMLDISRITRGQLVLDRRRLDLRVAVNKAIELATPLLDRAHHHFTAHLPPGPVPVDGDEVRLTQVVSNLLTNAAYYTDDGGTIDLSLRRDDGVAIIEVRDSGIGIDTELLPRIFDLFVRGENSGDRSPGGLGLGLGLVRTLTTMHGGTVGVESAGAGRGSTFSVRLPTVVDSREILSATRPVVMTVRPQRILLVDDNDDALSLLGDTLSALGHDVRTAHDPDAALDVVRAFTPDVAILDIGLPVMDGYELATRIRSALPSASPRMIALTGYGQQDDRARSRDAGFDAHLVKPIDVALLLASIAGAN